MQHRLSASLLEAIAGLKSSPGRTAAKHLDDVAGEVCAFLDAISARSQAAGEAARGRSGRHSVPFDIKAAQKLREAGESAEAIAEKFGVSPATVRRRLAAD